MKMKSVIFNGSLLNNQENMIIDLLNNKKILYIIDVKNNECDEIMELLENYNIQTFITNTHSIID